MRMGALGRNSLLVLVCALDDLHFKAHRKLLWRIARGIVAGLVVQSSVNGILGWQNCLQRSDHDSDREVSAGHTELLIRRERKTPIHALWAAAFLDPDISRGIQFQLSFLQIFLFWLIGLDVEARSNAKMQFHRTRIAAVHRTVS